MWLNCVIEIKSRHESPVTLSVGPDRLKPSLSSHAASLT